MVHVPCANHIGEKITDVKNSSANQDTLLGPIELQENWPPPGLCVSSSETDWTAKSRDQKMDDSSGDFPSMFTF